MTTIGQRLKQLRGELSQAKLGKMIFGVDLAAGQAKIKRIEAGAQELTVSEAIRIADRFGVSLVWFLTGAEKPEVHQPSPQIPVDKESEECTSTSSTLPFKRKNISALMEVEKILNSDDTDAINALKTGIRGILSVLSEKNESVLLLRQIAEGQREVSGLLRELSAGLDETGVSPDPVAHPRARKKRAV